MKQDFYNIDNERLLSRFKRIEFIPNCMFLAIASIYAFHFARLPYSQLGTLWTLKFASVTLLLLTAFQFVLAPPAAAFLLSETKKFLAKEKDKSLTAKDRTLFIKNLMSRPFQFALHSSYFTCTALVIHFFVSLFYFHCDLTTSLFIAASIFFSEAINAVIIYIFVEDLCSKKVNELMKGEVDGNIINRDKFYGLKLYMRIFFHIIMPSILSTLILIFFIGKEKACGMPRKELAMHVCQMVFLNFIICFMLSFLFYKHIIKSTKSSIQALEKLTSNSVEGSISFPVDLGYELEYNIFQTKEIIAFWQNLAADANLASRNILKQTSDLLSMANENASTSTIEYEKIKDNLEYITSTKKSTKKITDSIKAVHASAENTQSSIYEAIVLLQEEIKKMTMITNANLMTITGIKNLNAKIEDVWKVIRKIEQLAEKDKMIAFNAELKINAVEEEGQNFHIIAYSLRRLVATIKASAKEIKESLKSIQETADNLIITSEGGTQQIRSGSNFYTGLEENFKTMLTSSDITLESVTSIKDIVSSQYSAFLQINTSLLQMSAGFDQFSNNSRLIQQASEKLISNANELYQTNSKTGARYE
ncbi:MAG: methyl-accepting chemotaxis protein [Treponema sp.]|nr:methyl-accepting chemotaxis protein [Treponema sp.]